MGKGTAVLRAPGKEEKEYIEKYIFFFFKERIFSGEGKFLD